MILVFLVKVLRNRLWRRDIPKGIGALAFSVSVTDSLLTIFFLRRRYGREDRRDSTSRDSKDYNGSKERYYKVSHDREQRRKEKDKREDKDKRDDAVKYEEARDRRDDEKDKKDNEKDRWEDLKDKKGTREKKENFREKRSGSRERSSEVRDKKEKERDKDKGKEKDIMNSSSWVELKKCGITMDDMIDIRRHDYAERATKNRFANDLTTLRLLSSVLNNCYNTCITEQPKITYVTSNKC